MMKHKIYVLAMFSLLLVCSKKNPTTPTVYPEAEKQNINSELLERAFSSARQDSGVAALIVARNNVIVAQEVFQVDRVDTNLNIFSVTKSVISILIGIALDQGYLDSVDQKIGPFISDLSEAYSAQHDELTLRHLLTMSAGFPWSELDANATDYSRWVRSPNQIDFVLLRPFIYTPGDVFTYNSGACHLLSVILTKATQMSTRQFAINNLFHPLGTSPGTWSTDRQGYFNGSSTLRLGPHDLLKIGFLMMNEGQYKGQQIVSRAWVDVSTQTHITTNDAVPFGPGYGFLWWTGSQHGHDYYFANGWGGQFIVNVPDLNLTVVAQSDWELANRQDYLQWGNTIGIIMNQILPAVKDY